MARMNQRIEDASEYYGFVEAARAFLATESDHTPFRAPFASAMQCAKSATVASCIFSVASFLNVKEEVIDRKYIRKYLKDGTARDAILEYLEAYGIDAFDSKVQKLIETDQNFQSESVFRYVKSRKHLARGLLTRTDPLLACKQMSFILNCRIYFNIRHYVNFLGHGIRLVAFKAFEAFFLFFSELTDELVHEFELQDAVTMQDGVYQLRIDEHSVGISDYDNFLTFGWAYLPEKSKILALVRSGDQAEKIHELNNIINKYAVSPGELKCADVTEDQLQHISPKGRPLGPFTNDTCYHNGELFDHLFERHYRKAVCDCQEI